MKTIITAIAFAAAVFVVTSQAHAQTRVALQPAESVLLEGNVEFVQGATVDFHDLSENVGRLRGFVYVRVQGELLLMPVYTLKGDPRMFRIHED
jgi:hypothetical protein